MRSPCLHKRFRRRLRQVRDQRGVTLVELMVVVIIIAIFAAMAMPGLLGNTKDLAVFQAAQRVAEAVQNGRSRALATGSAHVVAFSTAGTPRGRVAIQQGQRLIVTGAASTTQLIPINSCRVPGTFGLNLGGTTVTSTVTGTMTSPLTDQLVFQNDPRFVDYGIAIDAFRGPEAVSAGVGAEMWVCFTPTGRTYVAKDAASLAGIGNMVTPVVVDIARFEGGNRIGLTRSVVITPGSAPRIFSSQIP